MDNSILVPVLVIGLAGFFCGLLLAIAARFLHVFEDPRIEKVTGLLPGANCGGCGYAGCADYAKAIVEKNAPVNLCRPCPAAGILKIAAVMGVEARPTEKMAALVLCNGGDVHSRRASLYNGLAECVSADMLSGAGKICRYGCLGYGNCARICPVGAIQTVAHNLAVVDPQRCISCGLCVKACPRNLIRLVPVSHSVHILCRNRDRGVMTRKACEVGCIACQKCVKAANGQGVHMEGNLAVVDYTVPLSPDLVGVCPQQTINLRRLSAAPAARPPPPAPAPAPQEVGTPL
jgi:Na+-translocating ferredoxin:NAD+ oxidoreductase subunit B